MHEIMLAFGGSALGGFSGVRLWVLWQLTRRSGRVSIGDRAPDFGALPAADGKRYSRSDVRGRRATVFVFMSNRCPGVKAYDERLNGLAQRYGPRGVAFVGVNSIDPHLYPSESLPDMARAADERGLGFVYLQDEGQRLARAFGAVCTPQVFVVDRRGRLQYRGRIDDSFLPQRASRHYLADALDDLVEGREVRVSETMPLGCTIDWAPGEAPQGRFSAARRFLSRAA